MRQKNSNIVLGTNSVVLDEHDWCMLIGDNLTSEKCNDLKVGTTINGKTIPDSMRDIIYSHPNGFRWFIQTIT